MTKKTLHKDVMMTSADVSPKAAPYGADEYTARAVQRMQRAAQTFSEVEGAFIRAVFLAFASRLAVDPELTPKVTDELIKGDLKGLPSAGPYRTFIKGFFELPDTLLDLRRDIGDFARLTLEAFDAKVAAWCDARNPRKAYSDAVKARKEEEKKAVEAAKARAATNAGEGEADGAQSAQFDPEAAYAAACDQFAALAKAGDWMRLADLRDTLDAILTASEASEGEEVAERFAA